MSDSDAILPIIRAAIILKFSQMAFRDTTRNRLRTFNAAEIIDAMHTKITYGSSSNKKWKTNIHFSPINAHLVAKYDREHPITVIVASTDRSLVITVFESDITAVCPSVTYNFDKIGITADDSAPSPSRRRNRFGIANANKNAALMSLIPKVLKNNASRANPDILERTVAPDTRNTFFDLKFIYTRVYTITFG
jgi:hypothetical protein